MAKKLKHFTVVVQHLKEFEIELDAPSESAAEKAAEKLVKNDKVDAYEDSVEVVDLFEAEEESEDD